MDAATLVDPIAAIDAAGEGKFEFADGKLIEVPPQSHDHIDQSWFLTTLLKAYVQERGAGYAVGGGFRQRLESGLVRVPDAAYYKPESLSRVFPTYSEGGADLIVEIVSLDSLARDRGEKFAEYERGRRGVLDRRSPPAHRRLLPPRGRGLPSGVARRRRPRPLLRSAGFLRPLGLVLESS